MEDVLRRIPTRDAILSSCLLVFSLVGCEQHHGSHISDEQRAEFAKMAAENEAIEKEAHSKPRDWIQVEISKYDGQCLPISRSARGQIDYISSDGRLVDAQKDNDEDYALKYRIGRVTTKDYVFVTTLRLCKEIIQANITK
jgi:hypothetical protein